MWCLFRFSLFLVEFRRLIENTYRNISIYLGVQYALVFALVVDVVEVAEHLDG